MPDRRARRTRNTLTIDLGLYGLPLLDACVEGVGAMKRSRGKIRRGGTKRGEVIRIALQLLALELRGETDTLTKALDYEQATRGAR